jgi:hypothetical protein
VPADSLVFAPALLPGLACSCRRGLARAEFGPGNAGSGVIGCGAAGLADVNYLTTVDHGGGNAMTVPSSTGPAGSVLITLDVLEYFVTAPSCCSVGVGAADRPQGADGIPCTADDPADGATMSTLMLTTGMVTGRVVNANGVGSTVQQTLNGRPLNCAALPGNADALAGAEVVAARTALDLPQLGDAVQTYHLVCGAPSDATPTATCGPPATPTPTQTAAPTGPPVTSTPTQPGATATAAATGTPNPVATPTGTPVATATTGAATPTPTEPGSACIGDCNTNGQVTIDELIKGVNVALGNAPVDDCAAFDANHDGQVTIDELIRGVNNALGQCP